LADRKRLVVTTEPLKDGSALDFYRLDIRGKPLRNVEVIQSIRKEMKCGPDPRSCDEGCSVGRLTPRQPLCNPLCALVVDNAAEDEPTQRDQPDKSDLSFDGRVIEHGLGLLPVDLRL
jgi:hypothetical protein